MVEGGGVAAALRCLERVWGSSRSQGEGVVCVCGDGQSRVPAWVSGLRAAEGGWRGGCRREIRLSGQPFPGGGWGTFTSNGAKLP